MPRLLKYVTIAALALAPWGLQPLNLQGGYGEWFRHQQFAYIAATQDPPVRLFGDSQFSSWEQPLTLSQPMANFGYPGDYVCTLAWRIKNGEAAGNPKVITILIGTNDLTLLKTPEHITREVINILTYIHSLHPRTRILLLGLIPRGYYPSDYYRNPVDATNNLLVEAAKENGATFRDYGKLFLRPDGTQNHNIQIDGIHLTPTGYKNLGKALKPDIEELLAAYEQDQ